MNFPCSVLLQSWDHRGVAVSCARNPLGVGEGRGSVYVKSLLLEIVLFCFVLERHSGREMLHPMGASFDGLEWQDRAPSGTAGLHCLL